MNFITFNFLKFPGVLHTFTLRSERQPSIKSLCEIGFPENSFILAEQIHSNKAVCVTKENVGQTIPNADALITRERGVTLVVRTADCGPVFIFDPVQHAIALVHSGKKGTQLNILTKTIEKMTSTFDSKPSDLRVLLGPCIRPPHYEVDFAANILQQAKKAGVTLLHDCALNTADDLSRFYSYRAEKGQTGRHFSALCLFE